MPTFRFPSAPAGAFLLALLLPPHISPAQTSAQRAAQLLREGKLDQAILEYKQAVAQDPSNVEAQGNLGVLQFFQNQYGEALPHLQTALSADPSLVRIQALAGICQKKQGQIEEAERNLAAALPRITEVKIQILVLSNLAQIYYAKGDLEQASATIGELKKIDPDDPDVQYMAYRIYSDLADSAHDALTLLAPDSARMHQLTAERFINAGDATMAIQQYEKALALDPNLPGVHYELGEAVMQESVNPAALDRAEKELKLALAEDHRNAGAEAVLGQVEKLRGHTAAAEELFNKALAINPNEFNALVGLGDAARQRGETDKAVEYLSRASQIDPMDDAIHFQLSQIYRNAGRKADADRELKLFTEIRGLKKKSDLGQQQRAVAH